MRTALIYLFIISCCLSKSRGYSWKNRSKMPMVVRKPCLNANVTEGPDAVLKTPQLTDQTNLHPSISEIVDRQTSQNCTPLVPYNNKCASDDLCRMMSGSRERDGKGSSLIERNILINTVEEKKLLFENHRLKKNQSITLWKVKNNFNFNSVYLSLYIHKNDSLYPFEECCSIQLGSKGWCSYEPINNTSVFVILWLLDAALVVSIEDHRVVKVVERDSEGDKFVVEDTYVLTKKGNKTESIIKYPSEVNIKKEYYDNEAGSNITLRLSRRLSYGDYDTKINMPVCSGFVSSNSTCELCQIPMLMYKPNITGNYFQNYLTGLIEDKGLRFQNFYGKELSKIQWSLRNDTMFSSFMYLTLYQYTPALNSLLPIESCCGISLDSKKMCMYKRLNQQKVYVRLALFDAPIMTLEVTEFVHFGRFFGIAKNTYQLTEYLKVKQSLKKMKVEPGASPFRYTCLFPQDAELVRRTKLHADHILAKFFSREVYQMPKLSYAGNKLYFDKNMKKEVRCVHVNINVSNYHFDTLESTEMACFNDYLSINETTNEMEYKCMSPKGSQTENSSLQSVLYLTISIVVGFLLLFTYVVYKAGRCRRKLREDRDIPSNLETTCRTPHEQYDNKSYCHDIEKEATAISFETSYPEVTAQAESNYKCSTSSGIESSPTVIIQRSSTSSSVKSYGKQESENEETENHIEEFSDTISSDIDQRDTVMHPADEITTATIDTIVRVSGSNYHCKEQLGATNDEFM